MTVEQEQDGDGGDEMLAAEYVLRLLTGDDLAEAERRVMQDRDFARAVTEWEIRLAQMTDELAPEQPGAAVKKALLARLFPEPPRTPFWQGVRIWQAVSALCLLLIVMLGVTRYNAPVQDAGPLYTATIAAEAGDFRVIAVVDKSTNEVIMTKTAGAAPPGRILQVWAHGPGEPAMSVGLWPEGDSIRLAMPPTIAAVEGVLTLGVSEEPPGGSLTGLPSGRIFGTVDIPGVSAI